MREADNIRRIGSVIHPDLMGFVFYPPSPRYAYCLDVASIDSLPDDMKRVGVFVNESLSVMRETAKRFHLDTLQFHGAETPVQCVQMREEGFCIIKAFSIGEADDLEAISDYEGAATFSFSIRRQVLTEAVAGRLTGICYVSTPAIPRFC